ncbi:MAG: 4Fe-4S binding protein [Deltaproteobacteria bacterium]|nr:4Fe-4S binding protein [Deltaproteobacteria bacterium]
MTDEEIYQKFVAWLGRTWWGLTESEHLMPLMKARYTAEEAAFLTGVPHSATSLEDLANLKGVAVLALKPQLKKMCRRGLMYEIKRGMSVRYRLNDSYFVFFRSTFWPGTDDETSQDSAPLVNKYYHDGFYEQYAPIHAKGLRALPIHATIDDTRKILPYEDVIKVLDNVDYFTVSACPCRQRQTLDEGGNDCDKPLGVCLHFDELGHYIVDHGMGREITREETEKILKDSADAGLVHGISNWQEKPDTICNCCSCCCLWMEAYHKLGHHKSLDASNYTVRVEAETCKACGLCVKRCPMDALQLKFSQKAGNKFKKAAALAQDACIGCGVCVHKCPTGSLTLVRKEAISDPPEDVRDYGMRFMIDRKKGEPLLRC